MLPSKIKVGCSFCQKQFLTKRAYFIFNKEVGYHSFCSKKCEGEYRKTGKWLTCNNKNCGQKFYRILSGISPFNYCSKTCAAIVNNQKYPKWPVKYCKKCNKPFRREGSPYCSIECGKFGRFKYTKEELVNLLKKHFDESSRVPARRELPEISHKATNLFGSWSNALIAAGLIPHRSHDNRMYKRLLGKAKDGHKCDSISEIIIDNWLAENKIPHSRDAHYPTTNHKADWAVKNSNVFIEYFGLAKDSPRYDREVKLKKKLCRQNNIKLIEIYPKNLYPINRLDEILGKLT